jgi:hypothetical protein
MPLKDHVQQQSVWIIGAAMVKGDQIKRGQMPMKLIQKVSAKINVILELRD